MIIVLFFAFMFLVVLPIAFVWGTVHEVRKNNLKKRLKKQAEMRRLDRASVPPRDVDPSLWWRF